MRCREFMMRATPHHSGSRIFAAGLLLCSLLWMIPAAHAQQGQFNPAPPPALPPSQFQQGSGTTLEVPANRRQPSTSEVVPPLAPQPGQEVSIAPHVLRGQAGYQQVTVTITDQQGRYVTGLQQSDLRLFIDGEQRPIQFFRHDLNTPVSVGILVDTSGSMQPKIPQARAAIADFIDQLNAQDDVFLFAFSDRPYLLQPFTTNHRLVLDRLQLLRAYGATALFDTIIDGLMMVRHGRWDKKALLVITDGIDNESQANLRDVVANARRMGVLVYSIGIGEPNSSPVAVSIGPFAFGGSDDAVDTVTLQTLSNETGAKTFLLRDVGDGAAMRADCQAISEELREQYTVGFVAPDPSRGGYRNIRVDVPNRPGDSVRVRKGVTVTANTESASAGSSP